MSRKKEDREAALKMKVEKKVRPIFEQAMEILDGRLASEAGFPNCEIKILVNLPEVGWVRFWNALKVKALEESTKEKKAAMHDG